MMLTLQIVSSSVCRSSFWLLSLMHNWWGSFFSHIEKTRLSSPSFFSLYLAFLFVFFSLRTDFSIGRSFLLRTSVNFHKKCTTKASCACVVHLYICLSGKLNWRAPTYGNKFSGYAIPILPSYIISFELIDQFLIQSLALERTKNIANQFRCMASHVRAKIFFLPLAVEDFSAVHT